MIKLSVVIITYNEEKNIERCLKSVQKVADEIVIVDSFSSDHTVEICKKHYAKIYERKWQGYSHTKNFGNQMAANDIILSIDADEALSPELEASILEMKATSLGGIYSFNRKTNYCGQWIHYCGWYPDVKIRIFDRNISKWEGEYVHEELVFSNSVRVKHLKGDLLHYSFNTLADHLQRVNKYSDLAAQELLDRHKGSLIFKMIFSPVSKFFKSYVLKKGFLDGFYGFCICIISAFDVLIRYAKVIQIRRHTRVERV
jgi:glycosyltransferase involved in cell wall biosynthesis